MIRGSQTRNRGILAALCVAGCALPACADHDADFEQWLADFWRVACDRPIDSGLYVEFARTTIERAVEPTVRVWFYHGEWRVNSDYTADGSGFLDMCVRRGLVWSLTSGTLMKADPSRSIPREHDHRLHEEWARMQAWIPATGGLSTWFPERYAVPLATLRDGRWSAEVAGVSELARGQSIHVEGQWDAQSGVGTLTRAVKIHSGAPSRNSTLTSAQWGPMRGWGRAGATVVEERLSDGKVFFGVRLIGSAAIEPREFEALLTPPSEGVPDPVRTHNVITRTLDFSHADPVVITSTPGALPVAVPMSQAISDSHARLRGMGRWLLGSLVLVVVLAKLVAVVRRTAFAQDQ